MSDCSAKDSFNSCFWKLYSFRKRDEVYWRFRDVLLGTSSLYSECQLDALLDIVAH